MTAAEPRTVMQEVRVDQIDPDPDQPRKRFDADGLAELERSMASEGLLQPITLRPDGDRYVLIAGERRWRAAGRLGWETITAIILYGLDAGATARLQLLENIVRRDLNPVEEARALKGMLNNGYTPATLGNVVGYPPGSIGWKVRMLDAREDVLDLVSYGQIAPAMAVSMAKLSHNGQGLVLKAIVEGSCRTSRDVSVLCERLHAQESQTEMFPETKLTEEQVQTVRTFKKTFERLSLELGRINRMAADNPQAVRQAFAAESTILADQISAAIRELTRVRGMVDAARVETLLG